MTVVGKEIAFVSLDVSCQTAFQINYHLPLLSSLVGDQGMRCCAMTSDWIIRDLKSTVNTIRDSCFFPESISELEIKNGIPFWGKYNTLFWHDFNSSDDAPVDMDRMVNVFDVVKSRYEHVTKSFNALISNKINVFVVSNTQNNLESEVNKSGDFDFFITKNTLVELQLVLNKRFPNSSNRLLVISYKDKIESDIKIPNVGVVYIAPDESRWEGSKTAWASAFGKLKHGRQALFG
jgi:hypothetical protein